MNLTDRQSASGISPTDLIHIVIPSDTSQSPYGSSYKVEIGDYKPMFTNPEIFVTGGTYSDGTAEFTNNTGGTFSVSGFSTGGSGGTSPITIVNSNNLISTGLGNASTVTANTNSMIIGNLAGDGATGTSFSNFFGYASGNGAIDGYNSNFMGQNAGYLASGANNSVFIGTQAGNRAIGSNNTIMLGQNSGYMASGATYSNFIGNQAGNNADNSIFCNFIGTAAGDGATALTDSNFIGRWSGSGSSGASLSNFFGLRAGSDTNSAYSNLFGYNAGFNSDGIVGNPIGNNNIIIGTNITLSGGSTNKINIGGIIYGFNTYFNTGNTPTFSATTTGRISLGTHIDNGVDRFQVNGSSISSAWKTSGGTNLDYVKGDGTLGLISSLITSGSSSGTSYWSAGTAVNAIVTINAGNIASGQTSVAEGGGTTAGGQYSHAEGYNTKSYGFASHAEGRQATASGDSAHAEGNNTQALGNYSHAEGSVTKAIGNSAHAEGSGTIASGSYSHAEGFNTTASGNYSHAQGRYSRALGVSSYAGGGSQTDGFSGGTAIGNSSFAHGDNALADGDHVIVFGNSISGATPNTTYVDNLNIKTIGAGPGTIDLGRDANGKIVNQASDARLKENVNTIPNALETVQSLRGVTYNWIDREAGGDGLRYGFIAQEVQEVAPDLVTNNGEYLGVQYKDVPALLVEAIKQLTAKVSELENIINELKK